MASVSSSYRIPADLAAHLEAASKRLHKGKNWIINEALRQYLGLTHYEHLREEAARQSRIASTQKWEDAELWEEALAEVWDAE